MKKSSLTVQTILRHKYLNAWAGALHIRVVATWKIVAQIIDISHKWTGALHVRAVAKLYGVPVILHTDHAQKSWVSAREASISTKEPNYPCHTQSHTNTRTHVPVILHTEMHPGKTPPNFGVISYDCIQINIYMYEAEVCLWYRVRLTDYRLLCGGTTSAISHGGRTCPWVSVEEISNCAKEPYRLCKNILCMDYAQKSWVFAKEPQISAKEPQISANELRISTTEPCVSCQT